MGKRAKAKRRRLLWFGAIRRQGFVPTQNTKVCRRHFESGIAVSDPGSVDLYSNSQHGVRTAA